MDGKAANANVSKSKIATRRKARVINIMIWDSVL